MTALTSSSRAARKSRFRLTLSAVVVAVVAPLAITATGSSASADQTYYVPISKSWTISGHGYGHGHGMSQYGAQGAAMRGLGYTDIINFYYPGTSWARSKGMVRVLVSADTTSDLQVRPQGGLALRDLTSNKKWTLPTRAAIDRWRLTPVPRGTAVQFHTATGWHAWDVPGAQRMLKAAGQFTSRSHVLTLLVPSGSDVTAKRYRGTLRSVPPYAGASVRDTVNVLPMDSYVRGVVPYEMPASWDAAALRSQAVAARTYAAWLRAQNPRRYYQVCDTTSCQVYGGVTAEQTSSNDAVTATAGKILTYQGKPAFTQFSSSSGGWTSKGSVPYLPAKKDPYDNIAMNANHSWKVVVSARSLERSHPEIGTLRDLRVTSREGHGEWGGRVLQIVLHGSKGNAMMTGDDFRWQYGLKSSWFNIAPTPIIQRWHAIGAAKSSIGRPSSAEYRLDDGSAQNFTQGRIYWSDKTGAREMMGPLLFTYRAFGGPASRVGWPMTGIMKAPLKGHKIRLQRGYLFSKPGLGASVMFGPVLERWSRAEGGPSGHLGYPTSNVHAVAEGQRASFQHGSITWVRKTNTFRVVERN
jgi:stage II sporulation protein D